MAVELFANSRENPIVRSRREPETKCDKRMVLHERSSPRSRSCCCFQFERSSTLETHDEIFPWISIDKISRRHRMKIENYTFEKKKKMAYDCDDFSIRSYLAGIISKSCIDESNKLCKYRFSWINNWFWSRLFKGYFLSIFETFFKL